MHISNLILKIVYRCVKSNWHLGLLPVLWSDCCLFKNLLFSILVMKPFFFFVFYMFKNIFIIVGLSKKNQITVFFLLSSVISTEKQIKNKVSHIVVSLFSIYVFECSSFWYQYHVNIMIRNIYTF